MNSAQTIDAQLLLEKKNSIKVKSNAHLTVSAVLLYN
jgi:hypothetical protein